MDAGDDEGKDPGSSGVVEEGIPIGKHPRHNNFPTLFFLGASVCSFVLLLSFFFVFFPIVSFPKLLSLSLVTNGSFPQGHFSASEHSISNHLNTVLPIWHHDNFPRWEH
jgi:hypothetical protein